MSLFNDVFDSAGGLLREAYPHEKPWHVNVSLGKVNPVLINNAFTTANGVFNSNATLRLAVPWGNLDSTVTANSIVANIRCRTNITPYLTFGAHVERKHEQPKLLKDELELNAEYRPVYDKQSISPKVKLSFLPFYNYATLSSVLSVPLCDNLTSRFAAEVTSNLAANGGSALSKLRLGTSFTQQTCASTLYTVGAVTSPTDNNMLGRITGFFHCRKNSVDFGTEMNHSMEFGKTDIATMIKFPFPAKLDDSNASDSICKVKLTQDGKLALALSHKINPQVTATFGTQIDTIKSDVVKYGIKFDVVA